MPLRQPYEEPIGYCGGIPYFLKDGCPKALRRLVDSERSRSEKLKEDLLRCDLVNMERMNKGLSTVSLAEYRRQYLCEDSEGNPLSDDDIKEMLSAVDNGNRVVDYSVESDITVVDKRIHYVSAEEVKNSVPAGFEGIENIVWYPGYVVFAFDNFDEEYEEWIGFPAGKLSMLNGCKFFVEDLNTKELEHVSRHYYAIDSLGVKYELIIGIDAYLSYIAVDFNKIVSIPAEAEMQSENCAYDIVKRMYLDLLSDVPDEENY